MSEEKKQLNPVLSAMTYVFDFTYSLLLHYSKIVLLLIVLIVSAEVFSRQFLHTSIHWSEEVALFLMVWMAFLSMAIGVQKGVHIALGFFVQLMPEKLRWYVNKFDLLIIMGFGVFMVYYGAKLVQSTMSSTLPATQWPAGLLYLMIPVSGVYIVYFAGLDFFGLKEYEHTQFYQDDEKNGGEA
ncbi:TRAP transporter small permease [Selenomonas montiformis]|uniref:TRAP transporter small permease n=1 Tax=Selenomonas montiformis TaxID=2652285 RepID=A0A6I2UUU5_9FIRM|nr:TRAP transporter small permease [Selenomonas montiformis]MSV24977.1 TRAP transporter small permease [Selenomonas montiformis]